MSEKRPAVSSRRTKLPSRVVYEDAKLPLEICDCQACCRSPAPSSCKVLRIIGCHIRSGDLLMQWCRTSPGWRYRVCFSNGCPLRSWADALIFDPTHAPQPRIAGCANSCFDKPGHLLGLRSVELVLQLGDR